MKNKLLSFFIFFSLSSSVFADESLFCNLQYYQANKIEVEATPDGIKLINQWNTLNFKFDSYTLEEYATQKSLTVYTGPTKTIIVLTPENKFLYADYLDEEESVPEYTCPRKPTSGGGN